MRSKISVPARAGLSRCVCSQSGYGPESWRSVNERGGCQSTISVCQRIGPAEELQAVAEVRAALEPRGRLDDAEPKPRGRDRLEVPGVGEEREGLLEACARRPGFARGRTPCGPRRWTRRTIRGDGDQRDNRSRGPRARAARVGLLESDASPVLHARARARGRAPGRGRAARRRHRPPHRPFAATIASSSASRAPRSGSRGASVNRPDLGGDASTSLREQRRRAASRRGDVYVVDAFAGADPAHRLAVRVVTESPWHALFARTLFIDPTERRARRPPAGGARPPCALRRGGPGRGRDAQRDVHPPPPDTWPRW